MKLELPGKIFEKYSDIKFREYPSSGTPKLFRADRRTVGRTISQFYKHA